MNPLTRLLKADRMQAARQPDPVSRRLARTLLGGFLIFAGVSHLTFARNEFQAQVPPQLPLSNDAVVLASGVVEISLGTALVVAKQQRLTAGKIAALFFLAIFPGNISQYVYQRDGFGLDTDQKRLIRLFFQPVLIGLALWSAGVWPKPKHQLCSKPLASDETQ